MNRLPRLSTATRLRLWRWVTTCIVVAALWPAAARVFAAVHGGDAAWVSVCTTDGARWVRMQTVPGEPAPSHVSPGGVCLWCAQSQFSLAAPPAVDAGMAFAVYRQPTGRLACTALPVTALCDAVVAEPRAPPLRT
jgi:hypothetical protein